jgi:DNA-binding transcriptional ArsR family regulator
MARGGVSEHAGGEGDSDIAQVGVLVADRRRARILLALGDGRALPVTRLAEEAGVSAATASSHLAKLRAGGLLTVEAHGRHRYYRLSGREAGELIEALQRFAPAAPIRSLREGTRAAALRRARTCYDHLAGRLGVQLMAAFLEHGLISGGDGVFDPLCADQDQRRGFGRDIDYALTDDGQAFVADFGVDLPPRRRTVRYCVDWSEQRHHLAGGLGRGLLERLTELGWLRRSAATRAVDILPAGATGLREVFGIDDIST